MDFTETFEITTDHIKLIQRCNPGWDDCEFGAAGVDPKRPYGNSDVYGDMGKILGIKPDQEGDFSSADKSMMDRLHGELRTVLGIAFSTLRFEPGVYTREKYSSKPWVKVS